MTPVGLLFKVNSEGLFTCPVNASPVDYAKSTTMKPKPKKKLTKEEKLAKDRLRKKEKYEIIKNDPELYAAQKEKERKRYLLRKEQNKITSIKEMTPRAQREQRKRWRLNSTKYLKKKKEVETIERILLDNSPPPSDAENANIDESRENRDPLQLQINNQKTSRPTMDVSARIRKLRYKHVKEVNRLKSIVSNLKTRLNTAQKKKEKESAEDSIKKRVDDLVSNVQGDKREEIKKRLLFGEAISKNLKTEYKNLDKKNKKPFANQIIQNRDQLKKYHILHKVPFTSRTQEKKTTAAPNALSEKIKRFLEDDSNSSLAAGKKEFIKYKGEKKQKRYLRETLGNLHDKFCKEELKVGYSTFCRFRPAWIVSPRTRDTCACKLHSNVDLIIASLKKVGILNVSSSAEMLKYICCNTTDEMCLERQCSQCAKKAITYEEFNNEEKICYYQWLTEKQNYKGKDGKEKTTKVTIKKKLEDYPRNIIHNFEDQILPKFMLHVKNIALQYKTIKELKTKMKNDEILVHIDFSENYCLKYNSEIQSFHFGGSRGQVSLHTGVLYYKDSAADQKINNKSFCTVSKCLQHDAASVWAHLIPVLDMAKELVPSIKVVHFLSDSPTSQYRNKFIFYMMTQLKEHVPNIERVTWNYMEAGHGKGAPDGIGAVVKRTADHYVNHGGDIGSFESFVDVISQNVRNVKIITIEEETILNTKFPSNIPTFKGTMNVHQAIWCNDLPHTVAFRKLSCFMCESSFIPCHHNRHLGVLSTGIDSRHTNQRDRETCNTGVYEHNERSNEVHSTDLSIHREVATEISEFSVTNLEPIVQPMLNDNIYDLYLDSPTIQNNLSNIDDSVLLNQIDDQAFLSASKTASPQTIVHETTETRSVQILSNVIKYDWQNQQFKLNKSREFYQSGQDEFKKFIFDAIETRPNNPKEIIIKMEKKTSGEQLNKCVDNMETDQDKTSQEDDNKENVENKSHQCQNHSVDNWVVVQYRIKSQVYAYIGKIKEVLDDTTYTVLFLKKTSSKANNTFSWPTVVDEDTIPESRIFCTLQNPDINRRGQYSFKNLPDLKFK